MNVISYLKKQTSRKLPAYESISENNDNNQLMYPIDNFLVTLIF